MNKRRADVGARVALVEQAIDHAVVGLEFPRFQHAAEFLEKHIGPRLLYLVEQFTFGLNCANIPLGFGSHAQTCRS